MQVCRHMQEKAGTSASGGPKEESWKGVPSKFMLINFALFAFNFHTCGYKNMWCIYYCRDHRDCSEG